MLGVSWVMLVTMSKYGVEGFAAGVGTSVGGKRSENIRDSSVLDEVLKHIKRLIVFTSSF